MCPLCDRSDPALNHLRFGFPIYQIGSLSIGMPLKLCCSVALTGKVGIEEKPSAVSG